MLNTADHWSIRAASLSNPRPTADTRRPPPRLVDIAVHVDNVGPARTRLDIPMQANEHLVIAFLTDTVQAAMSCTAVRTVTVVTDDSVAAHAARRVGANSFAPQLLHPGVNRDLTAFARSRADDHPLAVLLADLPAPTAAELTAALTEYGLHTAAFVADQRGPGTTLLYIQQANQLRPAFGRRSARRHHTRGAHPLNHVGPGLRRCIDTPADLRAVLSLGVGTHTAAEVDAHLSLLSPRPNSTTRGAQRHGQTETGYKAFAKQFGPSDRSSTRSSPPANA